MEKCTRAIVMKTYIFAVFTGFLLNKLRANLVILSWLKRRFNFFYIVDFMFLHAGDVKYLGRGLFAESKFNVSFRLNRVDIDKMRIYFEVSDVIVFSRECDKIYASLNGLKLRLPFPSGIIELKETFMEELYGYFDLKGKTVLDIGAFIGDTALYFALKGACKVVAYEPVPLLYEMAKENIQLNDQEDTVQIVNAAIGNTGGTIKLNYDEQLPGQTTIFDYYKQLNVLHPKNIEAKLVSFSSVVNMLGHVNVLKIDCEGAEWEIIPYAISQHTLDRVDSILMEVHWGKIENMIALLHKARFRIEKLTTCGWAAWFIAARRME
jgi:FkbM family methyltransferase